MATFARSLQPGMVRVRPVPPILIGSYTMSIPNKKLYGKVRINDEGVMLGSCENSFSMSWDPDMIRAYEADSWPRVWMMSEEKYKQYKKKNTHIGPYHRLAKNEFMIKLNSPKPTRIVYKSVVYTININWGNPHINTNKFYTRNAPMNIRVDHKSVYFFRKDL